MDIDTADIKKEHTTFKEWLIRVLLATIVWIGSKFYDTMDAERKTALQTIQSHEITLTAMTEAQKYQYTTIMNLVDMQRNMAKDVQDLKAAMDRKGRR